MEKLDKLSELFQPVFEECGVSLYEMKWISGRDATLQVSIMRPDGSMDLDTCADVSEKLSALLDSEDPISQEYTLEVCSPGAEREIRDLSQLDAMTGAYVFIRMREAVNKMTEVTGEITAVDSSALTIEYRDKAARRSVSVSRDNIEFIRLAVRI